MLCKCGCGQEVKVGNKYINGHYWKGKKHSEEVRKKISEANKGNVVSEETKRKISEALEGNQYAKGHKHSEETRKKISKGNKGKGLGKHLSEEHRKKLSEAGKKNKNSLGHRHSEETRKKIGESQIVHGKDFILNEHRQHKKQECIFECESKYYVLHHEPPIEEDIRTWEGELINVCRSCHMKVHYHSLKLPNDAGVLWTKKNTEKIFRREQYVY